MITLVLSLPFYSANALATSLQITQNSGEDGINNYIDGQGDVWKVEASINGIVGNGTVDPSKIKLKIGESDAIFNSCSDGPMGAKCEYISPLTDGIAEGEYGFQVVYEYMNSFGEPEFVSDGSYIKVDASAPKISIFNAYQNENGKVVLDFLIEDKEEGKPSVGLQVVEIVDAGTGTVLESITDFGADDTSYSFMEDSNHNGILKAQLEGEGLQKIKFRAVDNFGHQAKYSPVAVFPIDFVPPDVKTETLNFTTLGKFIGEFDVITDITIDIVETNDIRVKGYSDQAELNGEEAYCELDENEEHLWHCTWENVVVHPLDSTSLGITVLVKDDFGNIVEKSSQIAFTKDGSAPKVDYFGTERVYDEMSFLKQGDNRIVLRVKDSGAGVRQENIEANLEGLGRGKNQQPDECVEEGEILDCYWDIDFSGKGDVVIGLTKFHDNAGNEGDLTPITLYMDNSGPLVEEIEVYGTSAVGDKDYFQSNDILKIKFTAIETTGIMVLVDLNEFVMDAENTYPMQEFTRDLDNGWRVYQGDDICDRNTEGKWDCLVQTEPIKSGPDSSVRFEFKIVDTAGNEPDKINGWLDVPNNVNPTSKPGVYLFELLGLVTEENPDYWETSAVKPKLDFVDLDTVGLAYTKMPMYISFSSDNPKVKMLNVELPEGACEPIGSKILASGAYEGAEIPSAPTISRNLLYGGSFTSGQVSPASTNIIIEFSPFDGRSLFNLGEESVAGDFEKVNARYICRFNVFSRFDRDALENAEVQEVVIDVPFSFSQLGAIDENLAERIHEIREDGWMKFYNVVHWINVVVEWISYVLNLLSIVTSLVEILDLFSEEFKGAADTANEAGNALPWFKALGKTLQGGCMTQQTGQSKLWKYVKWLQVPTQILNCNPGAFGEGNERQGQLDNNWYSKWQKLVLSSYNLISGRGIMGMPASSVYENLYLSIASLCVRGILFNLEKAREIKCRQIICYGREVPSGIATVDSCKKLYNLQMCEFVYGPLVDLIPLMGGIANLGKMVKSMFTSPLGLISLVEIIGCAPLCWNEAPTPGLITLCKVPKGINKLLDIAETIVSAIDNRPDLQGSPYCDMADDIDLDELVGQVGDTVSAPTPSSESSIISPEDVETQQQALAQEQAVTGDGAAAATVS